MCVMSMIMDHYGDKWQPLVPPATYPVSVPWPVVLPATAPVPLVSPEEVAEFRRLLERAREYDRRNNEPDCELAEKRERVKDLARQLGIDVSFIDTPSGG
jgi:hypothetical protein